MKLCCFKTSVKRMVAIGVLFALLFSSYGTAEHIWSFRNGTFKSDCFTFEIPSEISHIYSQGDYGLTLKSEKNDIYLSIVFASSESASLDLIEENTDADDVGFLADAWLKAENRDQMKSSLVSTARIKRGDVEILEYRCDATFNKKDWIGYVCYFHIVNSDCFCRLYYLAETGRSSIVKLYYMNILDGMGVADAYKDNNRWVCLNCNIVNTGNYCSNCGSTRSLSDLFSKANKPENATPKPTNTPSADVMKSSKSDNNEFDSLITFARSIADLIAYDAKEPASGKTEKVKIGNKTVTVHSEFKYAMDVFSEFYREYFEYIKALDFTGMIKLMDKAEEVDKVFEEIRDMELSDGDMAYYLYVYTDVIAVMGTDDDS